MAIQTSPKTVAIFSESSSTTAIDGPYYQSTEAAITGGGEGTFLCISRAVGGTSSNNARYNTGEWAVQRGMAFDQWILDETAGYIALRYGDDDPTNTNWMIDKVIASGRKALLINYPQLPDTPAWTAANRLRLAQSNTNMDTISATRGIPVADIRNMVVPLSEMHPDGLHLLPVATQRIGKEIGAWFKGILSWY